MIIARFHHFLLGEVFLEEKKTKIDFDRDGSIAYTCCMEGEATPPSVTGMFPGTVVPVDTKTFSGDLMVTTVRSNGVVTLRTKGRYSV